MTTQRPRVLVLSRAYPNNVIALLGLWVRQIVVGTREICEPKVISPVPWAPPIPRLPQYYAAFRDVHRHRNDDGVEVFHPRFLVGPGLTLRSLEAATYYARVRPFVRKLRRRFPFDLIHAHFTYPDGVVAARLGRDFGVPVVITEQAPWGSWVDESPLVRRQMLFAAREAAFHIAISRAVKQSIEQYAGPSDRLRVIPDGVDPTVFTLPPPGTQRQKGQILFVGVIREVKGVDVLLRALPILAERQPEARLVLVGEPYYAKYREDRDRLHTLTGELAIEDRVHFVGAKPLDELVRTIQESDILVLPSRAESLGMVLVEALACGTPVVATRCGGPEDIVTNEVGFLVPPDNPKALAEAIVDVLERRDEYDPEALRAHALEHFDIAVVAERIGDLYAAALG